MFDGWSHVTIVKPSDLQYVTRSCKDVQRQPKVDIEYGAPKELLATICFH